MTQHETYAALAVVAVLAYAMGLRAAQARAATTYDPMGWLNSWAPT